MVAGVIPDSRAVSIEAVRRDLDRLNKDLAPRIAWAALASAGRRGEAEFRNEMSSSAGIPKSRVSWLYRSDASKTGKRRFRKSNPPIRASRLKISTLAVFFAYSPSHVWAASLGKMKETKSGVRAGRYKGHASTYIMPSRSGPDQMGERRGGKAYWVQVETEPFIERSWRALGDAGSDAFVATFDRIAGAEFAKARKRDGRAVLRRAIAGRR